MPSYVMSSLPKGTLFPVCSDFDDLQMQVKRAVTALESGASFTPTVVGRLKDTEVDVTRAIDQSRPAVKALIGELTQGLQGRTGTFRAAWYPGSVLAVRVECCNASGELERCVSRSFKLDMDLQDSGPIVRMPPGGDIALQALVTNIEAFFDRILDFKLLQSRPLR